MPSTAVLPTSPGPASLPTPLHPAQRWYLAEDLLRRRRSNEHRRYAAPQRAAKIDANPHQVNAVVFALGRLREGGCILADEVGLGKTIEAGLVIAQLLAEGAQRILLIAPKPLLGQWRQELFQLFDIEAHEGAARPGGFDGSGVFLIGREAAGSEKGEAALMTAEAFDLCVVDEAHEVFAGIYKRFNTYGQYEPDSPHARTAGRVRRVLLERSIPVLLLTATPLQNTLLELWGLVQYVDPLGTLLGDLPTFKEVFCQADHRQVTPGQELELRSRLQSVLQRTLRREAQEFLEVPFVNPAGAAVRVCDAAGGEGALRRHHELSARAGHRGVSGQPAAAVAVELPPAHGVFGPGAGEESAPGRGSAAARCVWLGGGGCAR